MSRTRFGSRRSERWWITNDGEARRTVWGTDGRPFEEIRVIGGYRYGSRHPGKPRVSAHNIVTNWYDAAVLAAWLKAGGYEALKGEA